MILIAKPKPIINGSDRAIRGSGWHDFGQDCRSASRSRLVPTIRSASRYGAEPTYRHNDLDFRVILRKKTP